MEVGLPVRTREDVGLQDGRRAVADEPEFQRQHLANVWDDVEDPLEFDEDDPGAQVTWEHSYHPLLNFPSVHARGGLSDRVGNRRLSFLPYNIPAPPPPQPWTADDATVVARYLALTGQERADFWKYEQRTPLGLEAAKNLRRLLRRQRQEDVFAKYGVSENQPFDPAWWNGADPLHPLVAQMWLDLMESQAEQIDVLRNNLMLSDLRHRERDTADANLTARHQRISAALMDCLGRMRGQHAPRRGEFRYAARRGRELASRVVDEHLDVADEPHTPPHRSRRRSPGAAAAAAPPGWNPALGGVWDPAWGAIEFGAGPNE